MHTIKRFALRTGSTFIALALALGSQGCVKPHNVPLNSAALVGSGSRTIVVLTPTPPTFMAHVSGAALPGGGFGAVGRDRYGVPLAEEDGIVDPATTVGVELADALSSRFHLQQVSGADISARAPRAAQLATASERADLVLEVRTSDWGFKGGRLNGYQVVYLGALRLVDGRTGKVIALAVCALPRSMPPATTPEDLFANGSRFLKDRLQAAAQFCLEDFGRKVVSGSI
jgi:hypothetical protein